MQYISSRGGFEPIAAAEAIKKGIAPDGGLFVPERIPVIEQSKLVEMAGWTYQQRACYILEQFLTGFSAQDIQDCVYTAYNDIKFDDYRIAPLHKIQDNLLIQELWHGPTCAFKDMALQILPRLLSCSTRITGDTDEIVILVATSGDTGKAALEGFRDVSGTRIIVFFPEDGVSEIQKRQMLTQEGANVQVIAVKGNFDDAQNGVKQIFADQELAGVLAGHSIKLSSANSINWGRLLPQIVYYVSAYVDIMAQNAIEAGSPINVVVPTGNFGNILAAFYARRMGININRLICASNSNHVLTEFIKTGVYDRNRQFFKTLSPSMDILISSNLERLLYEITGHDAQRVKQWMQELNAEGKYAVDEKTRQAISELFWSDFCTDDETLKVIASIWAKDHYLLDTHTAVAVDVYQKYRRQNQDDTLTLIVSTASPYKFGASVGQAILPPELITDKDEFTILQELSQATGIRIPEAIQGLELKPVRFSQSVSSSGMQAAVKEYLDIK